MTAVTRINHTYPATGEVFVFRADGYFNMTKAANTFNRALENFLRSPSTQEYMNSLSRVMTNPVDSTELVISERGRYGGTWVHPRMAVFAARWLDTDFSVWCDTVINDILNGSASVMILDEKKAESHKLPQSYLEAMKELVFSLEKQETLRLEVEAKSVIIEQKEEVIAIAAPKAEFYDSFISIGTHIGFRDAATNLNANRDDMREFMMERRWIYKSGSGKLRAYAYGVDSGYVAQKFTADRYGMEHESVFLTKKGVAYLAKHLPDSAFKQGKRGA